MPAGVTPNPTYEEVCSGMTGHTEVVRVVYRSEQVSYEKLLHVFWENHDPTQGMRQGNDVGTQYRSGIYATSPEQRAAAEAPRPPMGEALAAARLRRRSPPRSRTPGRSTSPRTITSNIWPRTRWAIAAWAAPAFVPHRDGRRHG